MVVINADCHVIESEESWEHMEGEDQCYSHADTSSQPETP